MAPHDSGVHTLRIRYQLVSKGFLVWYKFERKLKCARTRRIESIWEGRGGGGGEGTKVRRNNKGK